MYCNITFFHCKMEMNNLSYLEICTFNDVICNIILKCTENKLQITDG